MECESNLGERLLMVLGIWSIGELTEIDRLLSDGSSISGNSGEDDNSNGELWESSVSSTSNGGGNENGKMGDLGIFGKIAGKNVDSCVATVGWLLNMSDEIGELDMFKLQ